MSLALSRGLLFAFFMLVCCSTAAAVDCCCNLSGSCQGRVCRICDNCTGCVIVCNGCESSSECFGCLSTSVSGEFEGVRVADAVAYLSARTPIKVLIVGDESVRVSLSFRNMPTGELLDRIQVLSGVQLEISMYHTGAAGAGGDGCAGNSGESGMRQAFARAVRPRDIPQERRWARAT